MNELLFNKKRKRIGELDANSTKNPTIDVQIGQNLYYLGDIMDKHVHAGKDVVCWTSPLTNSEKSTPFTVKKGSYLGKVFSYSVKANVEGKLVLALIFWENSYSPKWKYKVAFDSQVIDEKILRYNYASVQYKYLPDGWFGSWHVRNSLPTKSESDTQAAEMDTYSPPTNTPTDKDNTKWIIGGALFVVGLALVFSGGNSGTTVVVPKMSGTRKRKSKKKKHARR